MAYNMHAIREFIRDYFNEEDLDTLCFDYFHEVTERFGTGMSKNTKIMQLVTYFDHRGKLDELLEKIKGERPEQYEEYKAQLGSKDGSDVLELDEVRAQASGLEEMLGPMDAEDLTLRHESVTPDSSGGATHLLAGTLQEIKQWFLNEIGYEEQIFVITAAMFSGLERQELMTIYKDVLDILKPDDSQSYGEA